MNLKVLMRTVGYLFAHILRANKTFFLTVASGGSRLTCHLIAWRNANYPESDGHAYVQKSVTYFDRYVKGRK